MKNYYVNTQAQYNGDHEVHTADCQFIPSLLNRKAIGQHENCKAAVTEAKKTYSKADGCKTCSNDCHKS